MSVPKPLHGLHSPLRTQEQAVLDRIVNALRSIGGIDDIRDTTALDGTTIRYVDAVINYRNFRIVAREVK